MNAYAQDRSPTVSAQEPVGLFEYLQAFVGSLEMEILLGLLIAGILGQGAAYVLKWAKQEIKPGIISYLFVDEPRKTLLTFIGYLTAALAAVAAGLFVGDNDAFVGWKAVLTWGLTAGFALDLAANKGETKVFTAAERKVARKQITEKEKEK